MKKIILSLIALTLLLFTGCLSFTNGYCDGREFTTKNTPIYKKLPVTYSISVVQAEDTDRPVFGKTPESFKQSIELALEKTGLFSSVRHTREPQDDYHIVFKFWRAGTSKDAAVAVGTICGASLFLIPAGEDLTLDASATITLRQRGVAGFCEAERVRVIYWLPFLPFFVSGLVSVDYMDQKVVDSIVNDVATYHYENFVKGVAPKE